MRAKRRNIARFTRCDPQGVLKKEKAMPSVCDEFWKDYYMIRLGEQPKEKALPFHSKAFSL